MPASRPPVEAVEATTADGLVLRGELVRGTGTTWLVLVHDVGEDIDVWRPLREQLEPQGWNLLALDLRGHGGSDGATDPDRYALDVDLGVNVARRSGAEHVSVVAAGAAAIACLESVTRAVDEPSFALADSLVLLSPGPLEGVDRSRLRGEGLATLVVSEARGPRAEDARATLEASIGWTVGVTYPTDVGGTSLLAGEFGPHIADKVGTFVREQAALGGPGLERIRAVEAQARARTTS